MKTPFLGWKAILVRNNLFGNYEYDIPFHLDKDFDDKRILRGDLRRFEEESLSAEFLGVLEEDYDVNPIEADKIIRALLGLPVLGCEECEKQKERSGPVLERCKNHKIEIEGV